MAKTNPSTIVLKGNPLYKEYPLAPLDACGNGAIYPGMLVELVAGEVRPHSTEGGNATPMFAVEGLNKSPDSITMGDIDDPYDDDNGVVKVGFFNDGDEVYALVGAGDTITKHDLLQSASDGYLMTYSASSPPPLRPVARALETKDNSAGVTYARVRVEVL